MIAYIDEAVAPENCAQLLADWRRGIITAELDLLCPHWRDEENIAYINRYIAAALTGYESQVWSKLYSIFDLLDYDDDLDPVAEADRITRKLAPCADPPMPPMTITLQRLT